MFRTGGFIEFGAIDAGDSTTMDLNLTNTSSDSVRVTVLSPDGPFSVATIGAALEETFVLEGEEETALSLTYAP